MPPYNTSFLYQINKEGWVETKNDSFSDCNPYNTPSPDCRNNVFSFQRVANVEKRFETVGRPGCNAYEIKPIRQTFFLQTQRKGGGKTSFLSYICRKARQTLISPSPLVSLFLFGGSLTVTFFCPFASQANHPSFKFKIKVYRNA